MNNKKQTSRKGIKLILCSFAALMYLAGCSSAPPADMVAVHSGEFLMGSNETDKDAKALQYGSSKPFFANESPQRKVTLPEFYIDKTEVGNAAYAQFIASTGRRAPSYWVNSKPPEESLKYPVIMVSWHDADAYCKWNKKRLPTEEEWEKAARGTDGRAFPWGNDFDIKKVNTLGTYGGMTPLGSFPEGASPYGAQDMAGNAQEWTADWYKQYPGNQFNDDDYGEKFKVVRGGGWGGMGHYTLQVYVRTTYRINAKPDGVFNDVGFRCAWSK